MCMCVVPFTFDTSRRKNYATLLVRLTFLWSLKRWSYAQLILAKWSKSKCQLVHQQKLESNLKIPQVALVKLAHRAEHQTRTSKVTSSILTSGEGIFAELFLHPLSSASSLHEHFWSQFWNLTTTVKYTF